jgi:hypothetical protein
MMQPLRRHAWTRFKIISILANDTHQCQVTSLFQSSCSASSQVCSIDKSAKCDLSAAHIRGMYGFLCQCSRDEKPGPDLIRPESKPER